MTPDSNLNLNKEIKSTGKSKYIGKYKRLNKYILFSSLNFFKRLYKAVITILYLFIINIDVTYIATIGKGRGGANLQN